jgi:hypothetical protein
VGPATLLICFAGAGPARAHEDAGAVREVADGVSLGYSVERLHDSFALGARFATPAWFEGAFRVTAGGGIAWYSAEFGPNDELWQPFGHWWLSFEGGQRLAGTPLRLYGFGGPILLWLPSPLADDDISIGGQGGFGFEFHFSEPDGDAPVSYFIELGGLGTGASASRYPREPLVANGFLARVGLRAYPWR